MPVLTEVVSSELVVPMPPATVHRTVEYRGENRWFVQGMGHEFSSAFAALMALREAAIGPVARDPITVLIHWQNVPRDWKPPSTGTTLP